MNGRMELVEILGMVGTCAALLFAGLAVETLGVEAHQEWAVSDLQIEEPAVPDAAIATEEVRLAAPVIERPVELAPPPVATVIPVTSGCQCESELAES